MHLFADYIQPITVWLETHPHWALFFCFVISFSESVAIIGSIIPGSITMTALGILAGSGIMRIDLTLIAATLGAIAGDGLSYFIGYVYSDRMGSIWPFSRYPLWLEYGKDFFSRHGGKSVLIGRFVGPLRSIIPVIAGMMHMSHLRFFVANVISGIGWACLYVLPGVAIGAASAELSPESATRLFLFVMVFLGGIWLLSTGIKHLAIMINRRLRMQLHDAWAWSIAHPRLTRLIRSMTPAGEDNYYHTALVSMGAVLLTILFIVLTCFVLSAYDSAVNQPVWLFLQSLRTTAFDVFFIVISELSATPSLLSVMIGISLLAIHKKDWRALTGWLSLNLSCVLVLLLAHSFITIAPPEGLIEIQTENSYPAISLAIATAQFSALLFYLNYVMICPYKRVLNLVFPGLMLVAGFAPLYLGDSWLTDVLGAYLIGFAITLFHWLFYRRKAIPTHTSCIFLWILPLLALVSMISLYFSFEQSTRAHRPYQAQYLFTQHSWWNQTNAILPVYRKNRIGRRVSLFNIQYAGSLEHLEKALSAYGWRRQKDSMFNSILTRINGQHNALDTPIMAQLYLNRKPVLTMIYYTQQDEPLQILRLWRSNYHIKNIQQPIWLGSVNSYLLAAEKPTRPGKNSRPSLYYITEALQGFSTRTIELKNKTPAKTMYHYEPVLLLIKEAQVSP
ncbi:VTT domain-containing protein [Legionella sp. CNM-4043-24]|uniref:VTT domain-containing protein n=1 Tax=Legionella sp. CNM-4043-24 TaxID=3421646 RepID=UPI00403B0ED4